MLALLIIILSSSNSAWAKDNQEIRIINGTDAGLNEFPFMVSIQYEGSPICGGTIYNQKFVITAAHCVTNNNLSKYEVFLPFTSNISAGGLIFGVANMSFTDYRPLEKLHDIVLFQLNTTIPKKYYKPVRLAEKNFSTENNLDGVLIGWGRNNIGAVPEILQKVSVIVYNDTVCKRSQFGAIYDMEWNMCAGWPENGRGSCHGDSGGPLLINNVQVGIIAFGLNLPDCGISNVQTPKVLTRTYKYLEWIRNVTHEDDGDDNDLANGIQFYKPIVLVCLILFLMT